MRMNRLKLYVFFPPPTGGLLKKMIILGMTWAAPHFGRSKKGYVESFTTGRISGIFSCKKTNISTMWGPPVMLVG